MAFESNSPNMNLPEPGVGLTVGPQWATDVNTCLMLIDSHNHSAGQGVQINPSGININTNLPFNNHNATLLRSVNFQVQPSPLSLTTDIGCLYVSGVDLYYNDENGVQIPITANGAVNSIPTPIPGLTPPASLFYNSTSKTFIFQSNTNTAANMDFGSIILRKITASSPGITISPPSALSSSYTITLPVAPPASTSFLRMNTSGTIAADVVVDGTTIQISSGIMSANTTIGPGTITGSQIAAHTITENNLELRPANNVATAGQIAVSTGTGSFNTSSSTFVFVTGTDVTLTTTGRPFRIELLVAPGVSQDGWLEIFNTPAAFFQFRVSGNVYNQTTFNSNASGTNRIPSSSLSCLVYDLPAGTYSISLYAKDNSGTGSISVVSSILIAYEI